MSVVALCSAACSDEKELPTVADIAGRYEGYTLAGCAYFQNTCTADETITVTENADGSARVTFTSGSWGEFTIPDAQMSENGGTYTLTGSGQTKMGMGGNVSSYDCTYTAEIDSREKAQMQFKVAGVMGGLTSISLRVKPPPICCWQEPTKVTPMPTAPISRTVIPTMKV